MVLPVNWVDDVGMKADADYLNELDGMINAAYVKPGGGIPSSDLTAAVQASLGAADTAYQKPGGGVPSSDMAAGVVASLAKADSATQPADLAAAQLTTISAQSDTYTLVLADAGKAVEVNKGTAVTVTVPLNASVGFPVGTEIEIVQVGAGQVTIAPAGGVTIYYPSTLKTRAQWSTLGLRKRTTDTWILSGDAE